MKLNWEFLGIVVGVSIFWLVLIFVSGCCSIEYPVFDPNGRVAYAKYTRWFNQDIKGFHASKDPNGVFSISLDEQQSETELALQMFNMGIQAGKGEK